LKGVWNNNSYYSANSGLAFSAYNFVTWKSVFSVDATSAYSTARPADSFFIRRNKYDSSSYYVTVLNHSKAASFSLPLTNGSLAGKYYTVVDAQNYFGLPVASGTYNGSSILLPMNLATVSAPTGTVVTQPKHTSAAMGTFIIRIGVQPPAQTLTLPAEKSSQQMLPVVQQVKAVELYPNPAHDILRLNVQTAQQEEDLQYQILNEAGAIVGRGRVSGKSAAINVRMLNAGSYFIKVFSSAGLMVTKTFIKN
jgi:hypothetical protein